MLSLRYLGDSLLPLISSMRHFSVLAVGLAATLFLSCGERGISPADAAAAFDWHVTNAFPIQWPVGTNVSAAFWKYHTITEGTTTRVFIKKMLADEKSVTNLLAILEARDTTIFENRPILDREAKKHASWWNPEEFGESQRFKMVFEKNNTTKIVTGTIPKSNSFNRTIFLHLRIVEH
jgi:hypothetical protein